MKKYTLYILLFFITTVGYAQKGTLRIIVTDIESNEGTINAALYNEKGKSGFLKNIESAHQKKIVKINNKNVELIFYNIPYGTYAVSIFQDENKNMKLDRSSVGFPAEPWGISMNKFAMGPPKFKDAKFKIDSKTKTIKIKMKSFL